MAYQTGDYVRYVGQPSDEPNGNIGVVTGFWQPVCEERGWYVEFAGMRCRWGAYERRLVPATREDYLVALLAWTGGKS